MPTRVKQVLIGTVGLAVAVTMLWLGLWQMRVYEQKEQASAEERAALAPIPLLDQVGADGTVGDVYGRQVSVSGTFLPAQQLVLTDGRVLTALELADGRVLPVVRGRLAFPEPVEGPAPPDDRDPTRTPTERSPEPEAPTPTIPEPVEIPEAVEGSSQLTGIFMPTEPRSDDPDGSVRLAALAQQWPQQLLPGFLTLGETEARAQGLEPATVTLTSGEGSWQNYGYALQWWVFAAFAIFMTLRFVRALGSQGTVTMSTDQETL